MPALIALLFIALTRIGLPTPPEQIDRLPVERMREMVAAPMKAAEAGDLKRADALFDRQFAAIVAGKGADSRDAADQLYAMGTVLYTAGLDHNDPALMRAAAPYMKRAVETSRRAWPPRDPELAWVLIDYAKVVHGACPSPIPADVEASAREAYEIRVAAFGTRSDMAQSTQNMLQGVRGPCTPPKVQTPLPAEAVPAEPPPLGSALKKGEGTINPRIYTMATWPMMLLGLVSFFAGSAALVGLTRQRRPILGAILFTSPLVGRAVIEIFFRPGFDWKVLRQNWGRADWLDLSETAAGWLVLGLIVLGIGRLIRGPTDWLYKRRGPLILPLFVVLIGLAFWQAFRAESSLQEASCLRSVIESPRTEPAQQSISRCAKNDPFYIKTF